MSDLPTLEVTCNFHVLPVLLFALALGTRFYGLDQPNAIVFDELHYGRYAGLYLKQTFFFDSHPPLGKQLLALAGYLGGFQGKHKPYKVLSWSESREKRFDRSKAGPSFVQMEIGSVNLYRVIWTDM